MPKKPETYFPKAKVVEQKPEEGDLHDIKVSRREQNAAREMGISSPKLGVPDYEAIAREFGFSPEDLGLFRRQEGVVKDGRKYSTGQRDNNSADEPI